MSTPNPVPFNADATCESCGRFGAFEFEGRTLCPECTETRGACCQEFGDDANNGSDPDEAGAREQAARPACERPR